MGGTESFVAGYVPNGLMVVPGVPAPPENASTCSKLIYERVQYNYDLNRFKPVDYYTPSLNAIARECGIPGTTSLYGPGSSACITASNQEYKYKNGANSSEFCQDFLKDYQPKNQTGGECQAARNSLNNINDTIAQYNVDVQALETQVGAKEKQLSDIKIEITTLTAIIKIADTLTNVARLYTILPSMKASYEKELTNLNNSLATARSNLDSAKTNRSNLESRLANLCKPYDNMNKYTDPKFDYVGCFKDDSANRALPNRAADVSNVNECRNLANTAGARYFGLQNHNNCWLSNGEDTGETYKKHGNGDNILCTKDKNGEVDTNHVYKIKTNQELNIHDDKNTKTDNKDYDYYDDGGTGKYNYVGCWAEDGGQGLQNQAVINNSSVALLNQKCYSYAYNNNKKYYGLTIGTDTLPKCVTSNGSETDYKKTNIKGFSNQCDINGGKKTNQVYELSYTQADEIAKLDELNSILVTVKTKDTAIANILNDVTTINTNVSAYVNQASTAYASGNLNLLGSTGDASIESATSNSNKAFNSSALALQSAESARRLSLDLTQQINASQIAQNAIVNSNDCKTFADRATTYIKDAKDSYAIVTARNSSALSDTNNITQKIVDAESYLQTARTLYNNFKSRFRTNSMTPIINQIEVYIGPQTVPFTTTPAPSQGGSAVTSEQYQARTPVQNAQDIVYDAINSTILIVNNRYGNFTDIPDTKDNFDTNQDLKKKENFARVLSRPADNPIPTLPVGNSPASPNTASTPTPTAKSAATISEIRNIINGPRGSTIETLDITKKLFKLRTLADDIINFKNLKIASIESIIAQSEAGAVLAAGNASDIIAKTASEIARLEELEILKANQMAELAKADATKAAEIQGQIDAANAEKARLNAMVARTRATKAQLAYDRQIVQSDTINKQIDLMNKLNADVLSVNDTTTIEGFTNPLPTSKNQEINNYVNTFNTGLSLLDDPNQMTKVAFDTYLYIQNKKLETLSKNLDVLNSQSSLNTNAPVKGLKSMNNSAILNVEEYPDPKNNNTNGENSKYTGNGSPNYPNYLIYGNNGCLQYESSNNKNPATWDFKSCNAKDPRQQFTMNKITNLQQYNAPITSPNNKSYKMNNQSNVNFGFYSVTPNNVADQCLQLNNDGISVMPCNMDSSQRFGTNYNTVL